MTGRITMTPEQLKSQAQTYGRSGDQISEILSQLSSLQGEIASMWEGTAFQKFDEQFNQLKPKVENFSQLLHDINQQLNKTAEAVAETDQQLSQNFGLN